MSKSNTNLFRFKPGGHHTEEPVPLLNADLAEQGFDGHGRHPLAHGGAIVHHHQAKRDEEHPAVVVEQALRESRHW